MPLGDALPLLVVVSLLSLGAFGPDDGVCAGCDLACHHLDAWPDGGCRLYQGDALLPVIVVASDMGMLCPWHCSSDIGSVVVFI